METNPELSAQDFPENAGEREPIIRRVAAVGSRWVRYTVVDAGGVEHCVGGRQGGLFTEEDFRDMAEAPATLDLTDDPS